METSCTVDADDLSVERKLVVFFDICSSTTILEDLKQTDNLACWRNFLIDLKDQLDKRGESLGMHPYKSQGDGWILLFPPSISRKSLGDFIGWMSHHFDVTFDSLIRPLLQGRPYPIGLTFGIDAGDLVRMEMHGREEFLGRAINVAARLQRATKSISENYGYTALFSKHSFNSMPPGSPYLDDVEVVPVTVCLKNIRGGERSECLLYRPLG